MATSAEGATWLIEIFFLLLLGILLSVLSETKIKFESCVTVINTVMEQHLKDSEVVCDS
jgi:hypothetical protein